jgi:hypothetical protein
MATESAFNELLDVFLIKNCKNLTQVLSLLSTSIKNISDDDKSTLIMLKNIKLSLDADLIYEAFQGAFTTFVCRAYLYIF